MLCNERDTKYNEMSGKSFVFLLLILFFETGIVFAQGNTNKHSIEFQLFTTFGFIDKQNKTPENKYNINRTLLIYKCQIAKQLRLSIAGDTYLKDKEHPLAVTPYIKRAYFQYHNKKTVITAGLIVLEQFNFQRKIWELRYIEKTFQNKFKYGENRNIGLKIKHEVNGKFTYDFALTSGYSTPFDNHGEKLVISGGQTVTLSFCTFRLFNSMVLNHDKEYVNSLFITKELNKTKLGIELARLFMCNGVSCVRQKGASIFVNHRLSKNIMCFIRHDFNQSKQQENYSLAGMQYSLRKHTKISTYLSSKNFTTFFYGFSVFYKFFKST